MSERVGALKIILVLLGVFAGWSVAGYAYVYFTGIGVASDYATWYSIILWLAVFGAFGITAFKIKKKKSNSNRASEDLSSLYDVAIQIFPFSDT